MRAVIVPTEQRENIRWAILTRAAKATLRPRPRKGDPLAEVPRDGDSRPTHDNIAFVWGNVTQALPERVSPDGRYVAFLLDGADGRPIVIEGGERTAVADQLVGQAVPMRPQRGQCSVIEIPAPVDLEAAWREIRAAMAQDAASEASAKRLARIGWAAVSACVVLFAAGSLWGLW